ncbi:hypothetical protein TIFTF001_001343 [Ficus carica]|uniref:Beta-glucosidase n=1 Tax=Ficus carica TaxID=3494 RepID=A0AA87ZHL3_FICCA|nr:hypothetical protein TIFTF001_001343 [Ficus carica]
MNYFKPFLPYSYTGINEFNNPKLSLKQALIDNQRIDYYFRHLAYLQKAIKKGVNMKGYFAWSFEFGFHLEKGWEGEGFGGKCLRKTPWPPKGARREQSRAKERSKGSRDLLRVGGFASTSVLVGVVHGGARVSWVRVRWI